MVECRFAMEECLCINKFPFVVFFPTLFQKLFHKCILIQFNEIDEFSIYPAFDKSSSQIPTFPILKLCNVVNVWIQIQISMISMNTLLPRCSCYASLSTESVPDLRHGIARQTKYPKTALKACLCIQPLRILIATIIKLMHRTVVFVFLRSMLWCLELRRHLRDISYFTLNTKISALSTRNLNIFF